MLKEIGTPPVRCNSCTPQLVPSTAVRNSHKDTEQSYRDTEQSHKDTEQSHRDTEQSHKDTEQSYRDTTVQVAMRARLHLPLRIASGF